MKDFLTFLLDKDGRSLVKRNGRVEAVLGQVPTKYNFGQMDQMTIAWERQLGAELGIFWNISTLFSFYYDDAFILREFLYNRPLNEKLYVLLTKRTLEIDDNNFNWVYRYLYKGQIDNTTINHDGQVCTASIFEGGLVAKYKANKSTVYEVPLDDGDFVLVKLDGVFLQEKRNFLIQESDTQGIHLLGTLFTTNEGQATGVATFDVYTQSAPSNYNDSDAYFLTVTQDVEDIRIQFPLSFIPDVNVPSYGLALHTNTGRDIVLVAPQPLTAGQLYTFNIDVTFDAFAEEKFFMQGFYPSSSIWRIRYKESQMSLSFKSRYTTTYVKAKRPEVVFKNLASKAVGDSSAAASTLLPKYANLVLTSGDGLRRLPNSVIKTSVVDFAEFCRVIMAGGIGIEKGKLIIEAYEHFLNVDNPIHLGKISRPKVAPYKDIFCNKMNIGFKEKTIDDVNGKFSFLNAHYYEFDLPGVNKELALISPYYADPYAIELYRINKEGKTTTDSDKDPDVFMLDIEDEPELNISAHLLMATLYVGILRFPDKTHLDKFREGMLIYLGGTTLNNGVYKVLGAYANADGGFDVYTQEPLQPEDAPAATVRGNIYSLRRDPALTIEGLPDPGTIFNMSLTPKRLAQRQQRLIDSYFHGFAGQNLTFLTTEKNRDVRTVDAGGVVIDEDAHFPIGNNPLFIPKTVDLDTETTMDMADQIENTPSSCFTFERAEDGLIYYGFNLRSGIAPYDYREQAYKLLAAPNNDFSKLRKDG